MSQQQQTRDAGTLWTVDFVMLVLVQHFLFASYTSLFTVIPPYVLDLGGAEWQIGIVVGSIGIVSLAVRPFAGRWTYLLGGKSIVIAGISIIGISSILHIFAFNLWILVLVRIIQGTGMALAPVATHTIAANLAPPAKRARAMAAMGTSTAVTYMYAPVLAFWLIKFGFPASFLYSGSSALVGILLMLRISSARTAFPPSATATGRVPLVSRTAIFPTAVFLSFTLTQAPIWAYLPLLAEDRGLGNPGLYFTVNALSTIMAMSVAGPVADKLGRSTVIIPGLVVTAISMFMLAFSHHQLMFLGAGFLTGAGFGLLHPGLVALAVDRSPARERSAALATLQQAWDIGGSGGAYILAPVAGAFGVAVTFVIVGVGSIVGLSGFVAGNARNPTVLTARGQAASPESVQRQ